MSTTAAVLFRFALVVGVVFPNWGAQACSLASAVPLSELFERADAIVRLKATTYFSRGRRSEWPRTMVRILDDEFNADDKRMLTSRRTSLARGLVLFELVEVLTASASVPSRVFLRGHVDNYMGPNTGAVPYKEVRPGGLTGSCYASDYQLGTEYLIFLLHGEVLPAPLAPVNEAISGGEDSWLLWVRRVIAADPRRWKSSTIAGSATDGL